MATLYVDAEDFSLVVFSYIKKAASGNPNQWPGSLANITVSPSHPSTPDTFSVFRKSGSPCEVFNMGFQDDILICRRPFSRMVANRGRSEGIRFSFLSMRPLPAAGDVCGNGIGLKKDGRLGMMRLGLGGGTGDGVNPDIG
jgi:hypothetical protein